MSYWRTFVAVVKGQGASVLMMSDETGSLIFPEFDFDDIDVQMDSFKYRERLHDCVGIVRSTASAVVDVHNFKEGDDVIAELTTVEIMSQYCRVSPAYVWVHWSEACDRLSKSCPIQSCLPILKYSSRGRTHLGSQKCRGVLLGTMGK